jgi:hypothetical protein
MKSQVSYCAWQLGQNNPICLGDVPCHRTHVFSRCSGSTGGNSARPKVKGKAHGTDLEDRQMLLLMRRDS